jgi:hypothetical protein
MELKLLLKRSDCQVGFSLGQSRHRSRRIVGWVGHQVLHLHFFHMALTVEYTQLHCHSHHTFIDFGFDLPSCLLHLHLGHNCFGFGFGFSAGQ